jgi:protein-L-isoaspartate(D-aspartate) O-methyltransferase
VRRPLSLQRLRDRARLVRWLRSEGRLVDARHAAAFLRVPRHLFVPELEVDRAYEPGVVEIGDEQTMTSADFVAHMTGLLRVRPGSRVLEVGTGTGYQTAILAAMGATVTSIEVRARLHAVACANHARFPVGAVELRLGDGALGAPDRGPFDGIVLGCVPERIPDALIDQLAPGGRLVGPEGPADRVQTLVVLERTPTGLERAEVRGAWFVPMVDGELRPTPAHPRSGASPAR